MTDTARNHSLDAARGILMAMGVLLHAANVYAPGSAWIVADPPGNPLFGWIGEAIHVFRMPTFFWISGFFFALTYHRLGAEGALRARLPKLLVPMLATCLTFNVLQDLLVGWSRGQTAAQTLAGGLNVYHLWFLIDLALFNIIATAVLLVAVRLRGGRALAEPRGLLRPLVAVVLLSYAIEVLVRVSGWGYRPLLNLFTLYRLVSYAPFFIAGAAMYWMTGLRGRFTGLSPWLFVPSLLVAVLASRYASGATSLQSELGRLVQLACTWVCAGALLGLFSQVFARGTRFTHLVGEASYSFYLFHHSLVVGFGLLLLAVPWSPLIEFLIVCALTTAIALGLHFYVVRRVRWLSLAFNFKALPGRAPPRRRSA